MLSLEDNATLCRISNDTPMGRLLRRYWVPAALAAEVVRDEPPIRLRVLSEDLLAFRDSNERVGVVGAYCTHKLAPLFFGRNEDCGLRCVYHGWKFDIDGICVDIPNVRGEHVDRIRNAAALTAYPVREAGGLIWIYMGPKGTEPDLPPLPWLDLPPNRVHLSRWLQCANYAQGLEGDVDSSHITFLHSGQRQRPLNVNPIAIQAIRDDGAPFLDVTEMPYGLMYGARRDSGDGRYYWRVTQWIAPFYTLIAGNGPSHSGRAWVPVDDHHVMTFNYFFSDNAFSADDIAGFENGSHFPPLCRREAYVLPDGYVIDTDVPQARRSNDYEIDRAVQRTENYSGVYGTNSQDRALQENMPSAPGLPYGAMVDRTREHLVASDAAAIAVRRRLLRLARDLDRGIEPLHMVAGEETVESWAAVSACESLAELVAKKSGDAHALA